VKPDWVLFEAALAVVGLNPIFSSPLTYER